MEKRLRRLDFRDDQPDIARPGLRVVQVVRDALVAEAREAETGAALRGRLELSADGLRAIVEDLVSVRRIRVELGERRVLGEDFGAAEPVDVGAGLGTDASVPLARIRAEPD